jgi:small subunit ribosomal protein S4
MGKPKFSRKKYITPSHPWQEDRIKAENELAKKYGLKNKREIWKAQTALRRYRGQARTLLAKISRDPQAKKESDLLLMHLTRMNILPPNSNLDDVLALENETILSRRLQTLTYLKGLASTPKQARQLIGHGHIGISGRKITVPGYMVKKDEENEIGYVTDSPLNAAMHPARPRADFKSPIPIPIKKEESKPEKQVEQPKEEIPVIAEEVKEKPIETQMEVPPVVESETIIEKPSEQIIESKPEAPAEQPVKKEKKTKKNKTKTEVEIKKEEEK